MNQTTIHKEIYSYKNFLTESECSFLYNLATNSSESAWNRYEFDMSEKARTAGYTTKEEQDLYFKNIEIKNDYWSNKMLGINNTVLSDTIQDKIYNVYNSDQYRINYPGIIQRQLVNDEELKVHYDQGHNKNLLYAVVIYINDNYNGGELYFPDYDLEIKPDAGTMLTFPATEEYMHGTKMVKDGSNRYVIATFVFRKENE